ncbi:hypothetical protein LSH36_107g09011 [Paralvinella palmiformis]|uniref:Uncharacterized protein n=1 Tax=Paralvinella palmiformis TaxID=53620 RepID=A0AAD9NAZ8_9ANNE|nr:hypothetical protein LSH36_107g09011 [Paralvinella palmiformis]
MMAAASSRIVQHFMCDPLLCDPLIYTSCQGRVTQTLTMSQASFSAKDEYVPPSKLYQTYNKPIGYTTRGSGIDSKELPSRYRRLPIEQEEIEYIQRGGPE